MTDWTNPENVQAAIDEADGLRAKKLISEEMRDQIVGMAEFYHTEFKRRASGEFAKARVGG